MQKLIWFIILVFFLGCSPKVGVNKSVCEKDCSPSSQGGPTDPTDPTPTPSPTPITKGPSGITMTSKISGGSESGFIAVDIDQQTSELILTLPLPILPDISATSGTFSDLGQFKVVSRSDGSTKVEARVPLKKVIAKVNRGSTTQLPNGKLLPGGDLPNNSTSLSPDYLLAVYAGENLATLRLQSDNWANQGVNPGDSPLDISLALPIRSVQTGVTYGTYSMFTGIAGGFYIHAVIPEILASELHQQLD